MTDVEIVIRGGLVVDGTGSEPIEADVAVDDGRIVRIAATGTEPVASRRVVDAAGQVVTPGFIDLHSHADFTLEGHPAATTQLPQGVTTLVTGNCGWSPFPVADLDTITAATAFFEPELSWRWSDVGGFGGVTAAAGPAVNIAAQVGHSAVRLAVMGEEQRAPTPGELAAMGAHVRAAADAGAFGFSTGLIYAPGAYADESEVRALVAAATAAGLLYSTHMRNESDHLLDAVAETLRVGEHADARVQISHLKAMGPANHGRVADALRALDMAAARGLDVAADVYPYTASSTTLTSRLPSWALDGGVAALLRRLGEPADRERIAAAMRARIGRDLDPEGVVIAEVGEGRYHAAVGLSLAEIGRRDAVDPAEAALRVLESHDAAVAVVNHGMSEDDVVAVLRHPRVAVASDGWVMRPTGAGRPHPRSFGTFPRVLGHYVRDLGVLSLAEAVRKMTLLPASRLGLRDRGVLREGAVADIAVVDPATVADRSTFDDPWQLSTGVSTVLVAGQVALDGGEPTGVRAGSVLRRQIDGV